MSKKILQDRYTLVRLRSRRKARREALAAAQALVKPVSWHPSKDDRVRLLSRRMRRIEKLFGRRAEQVQLAIQRRVLGVRP